MSEFCPGEQIWVSCVLQAAAGPPVPQTQDVGLGDRRTQALPKSGLSRALGGHLGSWEKIGGDDGHEGRDPALQAPRPPKPEVVADVHHSPSPT